MNVLLVDDERELVSALAERLAFRDIDADFAVSADEALNLAKGKRYDLAVLDVKMPRTGGFELKRLLEDLYPEMKFIFLTGHGSEEDFRTGSREAAYYLVKPVRIEDLVATINKTLGG